MIGARMHGRATKMMIARFIRGMQISQPLYGFEVLRPIVSTALPLPSDQ